MELIKLNENEFLSFARLHPLFTFYHLIGWGKLKEINGWKYHLVGFKVNNKIVAEAMLLEKATPIKKSIFYSPKGFLIDYNDYALLEEFTKEIKKYVSEHNGLMLKIDPNVIYQMRDKEGNPIGDKNDNIILSLRKLGFKHFGFNKEFETMQPRFMCRIKLKDSYEDTLQTFTKTTRKHILELDSLGVITKKATKEEISIGVAMLDETAHRKKIATRPSLYYEKMKEFLGDDMDFFLCYIDKKQAMKKCEELLKKEEENKKIIEEKKKTSIVGKKLIQQEKTCKQRQESLKERQLFIKNLKEEKTYIGSLLSIWAGEEAITLLSGTDDKYKKFLPKYAFYDAHIREAIKKKKKYVNFFGISGIFDSNDINYGIYEIKKGFNPEVIELIGEFDLIISKFWYFVYNVTFKLYKKLKPKK
ncbi:MAG: lipid II:glycine glycyltransferase FemX [Bacilli bacterium]